MRRLFWVLLVLCIVSLGQNVLSSCVTLTWTAPGDDGTVGRAFDYDIRYSSEFITEANWHLATKAKYIPEPLAPGSRHEFAMCGLAPYTPYYVAIKTTDEVYNWSGLSNVVFVYLTEVSPDGRGDLNLNNLGYEVGDATLFTNYFVSGLSAFTLNPPAQIDASDVNNDNMKLTVADLAFLVRIVVGDAVPVNKPNALYRELEVHTIQTNSEIEITTEASGDIGALHLVYGLEPGVEVGEPELLPAAENMRMIHRVEDDSLMILLYDIGPGKITEGAHSIVTVPVSGTGSLALRTANGADFDGRAFTTTTASGSMPSGYELYQNYPNPFNPSTKIAFALPRADKTEISVYNITGQRVKTVFDGELPAGTHVVTWDGTNDTGTPVATGIYLYRITAGRFTSSQKMLLLK